MSLPGLQLKASFNRLKREQTALPPYAEEKNQRQPVPIQDKQASDGWMGTGGWWMMLLPWPVTVPASGLVSGGAKGERLEELIEKCLLKPVDLGKLKKDECSFCVPP